MSRRGDKPDLPGKPDPVARPETSREVEEAKKRTRRAATRSRGRESQILAGQLSQVRGGNANELKQILG
jgi:hypothetical protein